MEKQTGLEIAIIGMSGRFPGAGNTAEFWENLRNGVESISHFTKEELIAAGVAPEMVNNPGYVKANGYLEDKEYFDASFFNYRPDEAKLMDPQLRIFHENVWQALEDAGCDPRSYNGKIGLFAGASCNVNWEVYAQLTNRDGLVDHLSAGQLSNARFLATKIAYNLNLRGPAVFVDTACSTSLVAIHEACKSLLLADCHVAVAGAVSVNNRGVAGYMYQEGMIYSADGHCRAFDEAASGTVIGEGTAVVVLKTLKNALKDGDHIWAVIRGSAINNDGSYKVGYTAPSVDGQTEAIKRALKWAGVPANSISYVEAHGTGTRLGDPVEVEALKHAFGSSTEKYCALGSVKTNIGHLDVAAGVAGLIKTVLSLKHRQLPASLHFRTANPEIGFEGSPFYVNSRLQDWHGQPGHPLRAGVSSFGIGGTNAHVILEEAPASIAGSESRSRQLLLLSGHTPAGLAGNISRLQHYLATHPGGNLADISYTLQTGRTALPYRASLVAVNREEALAGLSGLQAVKSVTGRRLVFLFPGQGSQYNRMCEGLYKEEAVFRSAADACFAIASRLSGKDLRSVIFTDSRELLDETAYTQPALFIMEYALAQLLLHWGLEPDVMLGHSIGEYVAACLAGVFSLEDALLLVLKRGELMQGAPRGRMLSVPLSAGSVRVLLSQHKDLWLAAVNGPELCTLSGTAEAISACKAELESSGYRCRELQTSHGFHSGLMEEILPAFLSVAEQVSLHAPRRSFISNVTGREITAAEACDPHYWTSHLRGTVQFSEGLRHLQEGGDVLFVEVGPGKVLGTLAEVHGGTAVSLGCAPRQQVDEMEQLLSGLGQIWSHGIIPSWPQFYEQEQRLKVSLPGYAFEQTKYPVNVNAWELINKVPAQHTFTKQSDISKWFYVPSWKLMPTADNNNISHQRSALFFSANNNVMNDLLEKWNAVENNAVCVHPGPGFREISPSLYEIRPDQESDYHILFSTLAAQGRLPDCLIHGWNMINSSSAEQDQLLFHSLVKAFKVWMPAEGMKNRQVILLTSDLFNILDKGKADPLKALPSALLKVLSGEYPALTTCHIDVSDDLLTEHLYNELQAPASGKVVVLRHGRKWEQVYEPLPVLQKYPVFRKEGVYMITGGLGEIGYRIAASLLRTLDAKIVLTGRSSLEAKADRLRALEQYGGQVTYYKADIADEKAMAAIIQTTEEKWGPVNGVIHAAGIVGENMLKPVAMLTKNDLEQQSAAKITGLKTLDAVAGNKKMDFCLLLSSLSAVLGGVGMGAYAAANAFMDSYIRAAHEQGRLLQWCSLDLDGVAMQGHAAHAIGEEELFEVLQQALSVKKVPQMVVSVSDLQKRIALIASQRKEALSGDVLPGPLLATGQAVDIEESLLMLWQQFFGKTDISPEDDFFQTGGDSLKALTMVARIHKQFDVEIPVKDFFTKPTVRELSAYIRREKKGTEVQDQYTSVPVAPSADYYPLSAAQQRMYFLSEFDKAAMGYNLVKFYNVAGPLQPEDLRNAFCKLTERHESLRTFFEVMPEGKIVQRIASSAQPEISIIRADHKAVPGLLKEFVKPFDLGQAPLFRVGIIELAEEEFVLMLDMHHIITDGVSQSVLINDFRALYNNEVLPSLPLQYKDYAYWQQGAAQQAEIFKQRDYWLRNFADEPEALRLPLDFARPPEKSYQGSLLDFRLSEEETTRLREMAAKEGTTLFTVLLSVFNVLLSKLADQEDIVIGTPVAGRSHADLEGIIGLFVNTLAIRSYPDGDLTFSEFLSQVKVTALSSLQNQLYQYEDLIEELKIERGTNRNPLFDVLFSYLNFEDHALTLPGLTLTNYAQQEVRSRFDITLYVSEQPSDILLRFQYATDLFKQETIARFIEYFRNIISAVIADNHIRLSDIDMLPEKEKQQLLFDFNATNVSCPSLTVIDLFSEQVRERPDHQAVMCGELSLSYKELDAVSNAVAACINKKITAPGIVAIYAEPGVEMIAGMLGVLKAGCAFLPLDAGYHQARQEALLQESGCRLLLTTGQLSGKLKFAGEEILMDNIWDTATQTAVDIMAKPDAPAYVIYTSGSTGSPKGVVITNANLANYAQWLSAFLQLTPGDRSILTSSFAFDLGYSSVFPVIASGGTLHIVPKNVYQSPEILLEYIQQQGITFLKITPSLFRVIVDAAGFAGNALSSVRAILLGGEAVNIADLKKAKQAYGDLTFINHYGPTETTIGTIAAYIQDVEAFSNSPVIGKPIHNARAFILNRHGRLLPRGTAGELVIGGAGVGRGYLGNEMLTNEKFITTSLHPGKVYRTGDLVRWTPDGEIEFLGRIDGQLKIRGYRVEPGEIERRLAAHDDVKEAVVLPKEKDGTKYLVAYYVASGKIPPAALSRFIGEALPDYMVPSYYVCLPALPLTPNGKLNRKELPDHTPEKEEVLAPANEIEEKLVEIWSKVLGLEQVGVTTNFFLSGGDSIKSIQITARMRSAGYKMAVNDIFTHQTIRELSQKVTKLTVVAEQAAISGIVELSPVQRWFFDTNQLYRHHYNQSVILHFPEGLSGKAAENIFKKIQQHHDALRMVFREENGVMVQRNLPEDISVILAEYDLRNVDDPEGVMLLHCNSIQSGIDLAKGPLMKPALFHRQDGSRLLIVVHHLAIDGVSWRILLEDLETLHRQEKNGEPLVLPLKTDSFRNWTEYMKEYAGSNAFHQQAKYWAALPEGNNEWIEQENSEGRNRVKDCERSYFELPADITAKLLSTAHAAFNTQVNDLLLAALLLCFKRQYAVNSLRIDMEGHGRETLHTSLDFNRTIGWFTSIYPVVLRSDTLVLKDLIRQVKETLRGIPDNGIGYLVHRYMQPAAKVNGTRVRFNYLGQFNATVKEGLFQITTGPAGAELAPDMPRSYEWDISGIVMDGVLEMRLIYSGEQYNPAAVDGFMQTYRECLVTVADYCSSRNEVLLSPADLSFKALPAALLDVWQQQYMIEDIYPLSPMQESMLFHSLLDTSSKSYFEQKTLRLKGRLDLPAMERSLEDLVLRYDILRTIFLYNSYSRPLQLVLKERGVPFDYIDVRTECAKSSREGVVQSYQVIDRTKTFDLGKDPLLRVTLLQTGEDDYEYIWSYHHILMDGWCAGIVWNDFKALYNKHSMNAGTALPPVRKYAAYITWLENRDKAVSRDFWSNYLAGYEQLATLPGKEAAPRGRAVHDLQTAQLVVSQSQTEALLNVAVEYKVTINTILSCAWAILLSRYNNTNDVVFGAVVSGRPAEIEGVETMIGLFINTVPVRVTYDAEDTVADLLQRIQQQAIAAEPHHYNLLSEVQALNDLGTGLLDHIMVFENYPITDAIENAENEAGTAAFKVTSFEAFEQSNYDLALVVIPKSDIVINLNYNANRFDAEMMERVAANLGSVITGIIADGMVKVKDVQVVAAQEAETILKVFNDTALPFAEEKTMVDLFEAQVKRTPDNIAVLSGGRHYTYKWLNESANRLAALLRAKGIQRETAVAVVMHRDIELIVTLFAILKSGGKYVPVEPYLPDNRITTIFKAVDAAYVITNGRYRDRVNDIMEAVTGPGHVITMDMNEKQELHTMEYPLDSYPATDPEKWNLSTDLAYVIFTSGSSGEPKGVAVQHRPVINLIEWVNNTYEVGEKDLLLFVSSVGFDLSVYDLFGMLAAGGTVRVANAQDLEEPDILARIIVEEGITFWDSAPALLQQVIPFLERRRGNALAMGRLRITFLSGDWIPLTMPVQMKELFPALRFIALGGATEATVWSNSYEVQTVNPEWKSIPYGKPIQNAKYIILDKERNICPIGVPGDLYIGGRCLAQSYFNDEALSSKKFIADPFQAGSTLYDTGDMARWFPDGNIEFLGRKDSQVKIRGYRVELGEIESKLLKHDSITQVLTHVIARSKYDKSICAYYVAKEELPVETLRDFLRRDLPDYMVPRHFVHMKEIPVSRNGKVDRKKLPEPELLLTSANQQQPRTPTELKLAGIWAALLQIDLQRIDTGMNFFECGGHSVMAVHLINAIQQELGVHIKLRDVFEHTSIADQAILIDNSEVQDLTHIPRVMERTYYPVSSAQERLFYTHLLNTDSLVHNISNVFEIKGDIDIQWLRHAFRLLIERHESLRTGFSLSEDGVVQKIEQEVDFEIQVMNADNYRTVEEAYNDFVRPFDLSIPSLMRCGLLQHAELGTLLLVDIHHIVCDGLSLNILMNEFMEICEVKELAPLSIRYVDYAVWQQLSRQRLAKQQQFWLQQLSGEIPALDLPVIKNRAAVEIHDAAVHQLELSEQEGLEISRFAAAANVSEFMLLLSVYYLLLSKLSGNTDIVIGTDVTGRTNVSLAGIVGTFINQLPLRVKLRPEATYTEFLEEVKTCVLAAFDNQDLQYDQILALKKEDGYTGSLVDVHFSLANYLNKKPVENRFEISPVDLRIKNTTQYEFKLEAVITRNRLNLLFIYSTDLYEQSVIALFARYYQHILSVILKNAAVRIEDLKLEGFLENQPLD